MANFFKKLLGPLMGPLAAQKGDPKPHGSFWMPWQNDQEKEDIAYMADVEAAIRKSGAKFAYLLSLLSAGTLVLFIVWADFATLDETTKGEASVIPSSRVQVIQNLEGGIVSQILIREGQTVEKDQVLIKLKTLPPNQTLKKKKVAIII